MIWHKDLEFTSMLMEASMPAIGIRISNMVSEKNNGMTVVRIKVFITMPQKKVKVNTCGQTATDMLENGL